jgi:glycosyltransferase involved in cell wall biosynthesis
LCDAVTSPSRFWADKLTAEMGAANVFVVPVGVDLRRFPPPPPPPEIRQGSIRIVSVGELTARKGPDILFDAVRRLSQRCPGLELHMMGDGDMAGELGRKAESCSFNITFHGFVRDPYASLSRYDVFCLASRSDNFPVAIIEAMLASLPIVATDVGGIPELVRNGECGILAGAESSVELSDALVRMIEAGSESRRRMGASGERYARTHFSIDRIVDQFEQVYRNAMTGLHLRDAANQAE